MSKTALSLRLCDALGKLKERIRASSGHRLIWLVGDAISVCNEPNASQDHIA